MNIDEPRAVELLTRLVSTPSLSGREQEASELLVDWFSNHGFDAGVDEVGNAVGTRGEGPSEVLLLGHIDTFPGEVPVRMEGDRLYGRGSVDAKGPLCAFAVAAANLEGIGKDYRVTVVGAVEEESATSRGARHILARRQAEGVAPFVCVIGEPSNWDRVTLGYKGRLLLDLAARFPFSHSAGEGRLPAELCVDLFAAIERFCREKNESLEAIRPFDQLLPSLRAIETTDEGAMGSGRISLGFRLPTTIRTEDLTRELAGFVEGWVREHDSGARDGGSGENEGASVSARFRGGEEAYRGKKRNRLVRAFLPAIRECDGTPRFVVKTGTCDLNVVAPHWPDTPSVAYGPGDSGLDHTPWEHVCCSEYLRATQVLERVLRRLVSSEGV